MQPIAILISDHDTTKNNEKPWVRYADTIDEAVAWLSEQNYEYNQYCRTGCTFGVEAVEIAVSEDIGYRIRMFTLDGRNWKTSQGGVGDIVFPHLHPELGSKGDVWRKK